MMTRYLVRYSEIFLKSEPVKRIWQGVLVHDIYSRMSNVTVSVERGRVWVEGDVKPECLRRIFGIVSFSEVTECTLNTIAEAVSYTHLRAHETDSYLVCRLLLEKKK